MNEKPRLDIPDTLVSYIARYESVRGEITERFDEEKVRDRIRKDREEREYESRVQSDIEYAQYICDWVNMFRESETGDRVLELLPRENRPDRGLTFFEWPPRDHSYSLGMSDKGIRWYRFGPGSDQRYCNTSEELSRAANRETPGMLEAAYEAIRDGDVWKYIRHELELFKDKELKI